MDLGLAGKLALVTGSASGIGQAIAVGLAGEGASVVIADRDDATDTIALIPESSLAGVFRVDLSTRENVESTVERVIEEHGRLDLFVNNAAVAVHRPIHELDERTWRLNIETNLAACVWASSVVSAHLRERGQGNILIIGSTSMYTPRATEAAYRVSKTGLKAFMEVLAVEMAPFGVRVNMLTPGSFNTGLTKGISPDALAAVESAVPLGRSAQPVELVPTALLLMSDVASPYTTGANFIVDGGLHLRPLEI